MGTRRQPPPPPPRGRLLTPPVRPSAAGPGCSGFSGRCPSRGRGARACPAPSPAATGGPRRPPQLPRPRRSGGPARLGAQRAAVTCVLQAPRARACIRRRRRPRAAARRPEAEPPQPGLGALCRGPGPADRLRVGGSPALRCGSGGRREPGGRRAEAGALPPPPPARGRRSCASAPASVPAEICPSRFPLPFSPSLFFSSVRFSNVGWGFSGGGGGEAAEQGFAYGGASAAASPPAGCGARLSLPQRRCRSPKLAVKALGSNRVSTSHVVLI